MRTVSILVKGRVQGVFFRRCTINNASKNGICGFVKNTLQGDVYIEAEGDEPAIEKFIKWCHKGSPASRVESVEVNELQFVNYTGFIMR
ncbi:MAG: acylphosphatase [Bacteroidetes bacterium]|nr:acylphosphatase [Bacteroidota bacterium]